MPPPPPAPPAPPVDSGSPIPRRPLRFGELLSLTWQVFSLRRSELLRAALRGGGIAIVVLIAAYIPLYSLMGDKLLTTTGAFDAAAAPKLSGTELATALIGAGAIAIANLVAQSWLAVLAANATLRVVRGSGSSATAKHWPAYLGTQLMLAGLILALLIPLVSLLLLETPSDGALVVALLAALVTIVVVFWLALGTVQLLGVVLVEGRVGVAAIRRSLRIARGARWRIFAPLFVVSMLAGFVAQAAASFAALVPSNNLLLAAVADAVAAGIGLAVSTPFTAIVILLTYFSRRLEVEAPAEDMFRE